MDLLTEYRELLNYVDFDYEVIKNDNEDYTDEFERGVELIKLIDLQDAYLGDIADFRIRVDDKLAIECIIDRLKKNLLERLCYRTS